MCRFYVCQHFSFPCQGRRSTVQLCSHLSLSSSFETPSYLSSGQFQQLADTSDLVCLPVDFTMNLDMPEIVVPSGFIQRFHVRIVVTEAVFTYFHCILCSENNCKLLQFLFYTVFYFKSYVSCKRKETLPIEGSRSNSIFHRWSSVNLCFFSVYSSSFLFRLAELLTTPLALDWTKSLFS